MSGKGGSAVGRKPRLSTIWQPVLCSPVPAYLVLKVGIGFHAALLRCDPFLGNRAVFGGLVQNARNLLPAQIARVGRRARGAVERQCDCGRKQLLVPAQESDERLECVNKHSHDGQVNHQKQEDGHLGQPRQPQILHRPSLARRGRVAAVLALFVEGHAGGWDSGGQPPELLYAVCCMMMVVFEGECSRQVLAKRDPGNGLMVWLPQRRFLIAIKRKTTGRHGSSGDWSTATANSLPSPVATFVATALRGLEGQR